MTDEHGDQWDVFGPSADPDPADPAPDPEPTAPSSPGSGDRPSPMAHPAMPWVVVGVVVLVVIAAITLGRSDEGSGDRARGAVEETADRDAGVGDDAGGADGGEPRKNACPGYELGTNLFGEPEIASDPGVHVWHDIDGFHLRLVPIPGELESIQGTVVGEGVSLTLADPGAPGASDEDGLLRFDLNADQPEMWFKRSCDTTAVTFEITSGLEPVPVGQVTIGNGGHPPAMPFTLQQLDG